MALGTEEATFNAVVDTLIDAWIVMVNALDAAEVTKVVFCNPRGGSLAADERQGTAAAIKAAFDATQAVHDWANNPDTADSVPLSIKGHPLFFKVTNAAADLS
jgi:hypothetical protein